MADAVELKLLEPREALAFFRQKGYRLTYSYLDMMHRAHADAFTVAGVSRLDVLQDVRSAVDQAEAEGLTLGAFKKIAQSKLAAKGWWGPVTVKDPATGDEKTVDLSSSKRLETIFNTNLRTSYSAGYWTRIQRTKEALPYLRYVCVLDSHTRPLHFAWGNPKQPVILPVDHPWWKTHFPPNGWRCRCSVVQMTAKQVERAGWRVQTEGPNNGPDRTYKNNRTGETFKVPPGIDPSFAYNVGETANFPDPAKYTTEAFGRQAAQLSVTSAAFSDLVGQKIAGAAPVAWVEDAILSELGATVRRVDLSSDTMVKQVAAHPELTLAEYQQLPELIDQGLVVKGNDPGSLIFYNTLVDPDGKERFYAAVVKAVTDGSALFLVSFYRAKGRRLALALARDAVRAQPALQGVRLSVGGLVE